MRARHLRTSDHTIVPNPGGAFKFSVDVAGMELPNWTVERPALHTLEIDTTNQAGLVGQELDCRFGLRKFTVNAEQFLLNAQPIQIRGLLNWGYAPPSIAPSVDQAWMRKEIEFAKARGFNLMKFCLWIPPKRYLELCDEMGMLAWIEYPTWHPQLTPEFLPQLKQEYDEFFVHVRPHPSVVLHSLTCETGPSADLEVLTELYNRCKLAIPGAVVEDDSSWISWNRVHDFYDDHPYGNNHTWVETVSGLRDFIAQRQAKPLILGEAIAADTWWSGDEPSNLPAHLQPWSLDSNRQWAEDIAQPLAPRPIDQTDSSAIT